MFPRQLSTMEKSPFYDHDACKLVDKVLVDGVHHGPCVAYDMDKGKAMFKIDGNWVSKEGVITVKGKP